ncbi:MAG: NAD(P)H-dependent oxidoreductase subunit E, partial [Cloacibacillus sp.]
MITDRNELRQLRVKYAASLAEEKKKILICAGTGCISSGSLEIFQKLKTIMEEKGVNVAVELAEEPHDDSVGLKKSGCHGFCEMGPLVRIEPQGWLYVKVKEEDCAEIVEKTIVGGGHIERLAYHKNGESFKKQAEIPFYKKQTRHVLEHCGHIDATSIKEYLAIGGYAAFERALFDMT